MAVKDATRAKAALDQQIDRILWLRGTGPNPFEYGLWDERTQELLAEIFGPDSVEVSRYQEAAGKRGRLPGVRGQGDNMTLNIHGPWGIRARLDRGETVLRELSASLV
ncbi:MAG: hypothetical protein R3B97_03895 [Dehalococcoidia bacterium]|nr:hypothetical protein [Dehalococcoidia bacterium]MCA9830565.1 hypothetical protein [Dehalococcoidia bacterium]MCB9485542.1 hypothetical protein [Thermoflexaceae bacterium]